MIEDKTIKILFEHYDNRGESAVCIDEFREDVNRFLYVSRILRRYKNSGKLNVRLILNHMVILYNVFNGLSTSVLISYVPEDLQSHLFGLLKFFNRLPQEHEGKEDQDIIKIIEQSIGH